MPNPDFSARNSRPKMPGDILLLFGLFLVVLALFTYFYGQSRYKRLDREGQEVTGVVTSREDRSSLFAKGEYVVNYSFEAPLDGSTTRFEGRADIAADEYLDLEEGQSIQVIYVVPGPPRSTLENKVLAPSFFHLLILGGMGGVLLLIGLRECSITWIFSMLWARLPTLGSRIQTLL